MVESNPYNIHIIQMVKIKNKKSKTVLSAGGCLAKADADEMCSLTDPSFD